MKLKNQIVSIALMVLLLLSLIVFPADKAHATGACTAARFNDWKDMGCDQRNGSAGGVPQANCPDCQTNHGMPIWWVTEPYISLAMKDTPLSYTLSSGKEMDFQFYYIQRSELPGVDQVAALPTTSPISSPDIYPGFATGSSCGTNAWWGNNWTMSITICDPAWETNWFPGTFNGRTTYSPPAGYAPYTRGYEAFVWQPNGGINYYNIQQGYQNTLDWKSQVRITSVVSGTNYPNVEAITSTGTINVPTADANGIYWGDSGIGVELDQPDGSKEVFGLTAYPVIDSTVTYPSFPSGVSTTRLLLTQRVDSQGQVTKIGYEEETNTIPYAFRVRYVVDPDGRTNTFLYNSGFQLSEIDDPYGRKVTLGYSSSLGTSGFLNQITDADGLTSSFQYQAPMLTTNWYQKPGGGYYGPPFYPPIPPYATIIASDNGWITNVSTPYGNTSFYYYQVTDSTVTDGYQQRAIYVSEPNGAQQLYYYLHNNPSLPSTQTSPIVSGQAFDNGTSSDPDSTLNFRNTYHWGRRQFAALAGNYYFNEWLSEALYYQSSDPSDSASYFANALGALSGNDYNKADIKHWLLDTDHISIVEAMSSEQEPSLDAAGQIPGERIWYTYTGQSSSSPEIIGSSAQPACVARLLPDGSSQYTLYNYYPITGFVGSPVGAGFVSNNISTYSKPDGSTGTLTNWFAYAANSVDLASISNSFGQRINLGYNGNHQITSITNALNQVTTIGWNPNLTGIQFPGGASVGLTYNNSDYYWTNGAYVLGPEYGLLQNVSWSPSGRSFAINKHFAGLPVNVTDDRGVTFINSWDGLNRLTSTLFPDGTSISNVYNKLDLVAAKDRLGNWTRYSYDNLRHLTTITNANNAVTYLSWCGCGSLASILDPLQHLTTFSYDNQANLTNIFFPDSTSLTYQYDLAGRLTNAYDGAGRSIGVTYNNQGLPTAFNSSGGALQQVIYDALSRPISVTDANGVTVTNTYDAINELLTRKWPDGIGEGFGYSAAGMVCYTNRDGQVTRYGLDTAGRITSVTNANMEVVKVAYDSLNNVISLLDGLNHTTQWQYNQYGWLTNKIDALGRNIASYTYNDNGWVTSRQTPEKGLTRYSYDAMGNLTSIAYRQSSINYAYDALNRLTNMVDSTGATAFGYTAAGQLQSETGPWANDALTFTLAQGLRTAMAITQPSGSWSQSYGYDSLWRMTNVISPAGTYVYNYNSTVSPLISKISLPNGGSVTNGYDALAQLTQTALINSSSQILDAYGYQHDTLGLRTNIVRNFGTASSSVSVGYDNIGQIVSWTAKEANSTARLNEQLGWGYDAADNVHFRTNNALTETFSVDSANQLSGISRAGTLTVAGSSQTAASSMTVNGQSAQLYADNTFANANNALNNGNNTFTTIAQNSAGKSATNIGNYYLPTSISLQYDNNGNLTNDGLRSFSYDNENELTGVSVAGQWKATFGYDGLGRRRIIKDYAWQSGYWMQTNEVHDVYDGYMPVQERDVNNNVLVTYTRGVDFSGDLMDASGIGGLLARTTSEGSTFYHADGIGNITALVNDSQNVVARYLYNPFGQLEGRWGGMADANVMQFSSMPEYRGMAGYWGRFYDPIYLRWPNRDPIGELGGINLYEYVGNNPINFVDPLGLALGDWWDVGATQGYLNQASANGLSSGGVGGYLQTFGAQLAEDLIDLSGASGAAAGAGQSGAASADPCHHGRALGLGALTAASIGLNAIPGAGKAVQMTADQIALKELVEEATLGGRKALNAADTEAVMQWANETKYPGYRASPADLADPSNWSANPIPHIHLPGAGSTGGHIPVTP